jgi:GH24 family phage-related lysozyme (muramidase)
MNAIDLVAARLDTEEGIKLYPYDDATGLRVCAPKGHTSWGKGFNLDECGSVGLFNVMERYLLEQEDKALQALPWYAGLDPVRQSVCLDISYNDGTGGMLAFHNLIDALENCDWPRAAAECHVKNPELAGRYAALAQLILSGELAK